MVFGSQHFSHTMLKSCHSAHHSDLELQNSSVVELSGMVVPLFEYEYVSNMHTENLVQTMHISHVIIYSAINACIGDYGL